MSALKDLSEILIVNDDLSLDFITSDAHDKQLEAAAKVINSLVYPIDDEGEKFAKADRAVINKYVKTSNSLIAKVFKNKTSAITLWRDGKKNKTKTIYDGGQKLLDQFEEGRQKKLDKISIDLSDQLAKERTHAEIDSQFYSDIDFSSLIKLTGTLTPKGALTKKATDFILSIVTNEKAEQTRIEARHLHLENRCLRAEINPPLTHIHLGTNFYAEDDVFNEKVEELVNAEVERKAEMEARIIKQQEAKKQAEIDAALKAQQDKADAVAREKAQQENASVEKLQEQDQPAHEPDKQKVTVAGDGAIEPIQKPVNGKHEVVITAVFKIQVSNRISNQAVADHFTKQLPEKLESAMYSIAAES